MAEKYLVSARKYRPVSFPTVVGQEHITTTLKNAIRQKQLAHAYLFCGPRGVGKTTCARILSKTINCQNPTADLEACNQCSSCKSFSENASFNIFELDAASNNSVNDIRELIAQVRFAPQEGKYKIYIIDEVHMLSTQAFNAFLKTLEEPPHYAIFILATTEKHKILPTILSRCQIFDFKRITSEDIVQHLQGITEKEGMDAQESALHVIAQKSEGCMRDALSILDRIAGFTGGQITYAATMEHLNLLDADFYFQITDAILSEDIGSTLLLLDKLVDKGFEGNIIIEGLASHFRNLLICKDNRMARLLDVAREHKEIYYQKSLQISPGFILSALNTLNQAEIDYRGATNKRLHTEMCLIRLCYLMKATAPEILKKKPVAESAMLEESHVPLKKVSLPKQPSASSSLMRAPQPESPRPAKKTELSPGKRRISKNYLEEVNLAMEQVTAVPQDQIIRTITQEQIETLYNEYKERLREAGRSVDHSQFSAMKAQLFNPDEVRIYAPDALREEYAKAQRDELMVFFHKETGTRLRITTEILPPDPASPEDSVARVPSKSEIFEILAEKNPELYRLKETLGLQIEY